jgi:hypothetical protein
MNTPFTTIGHLAMTGTIITLITAALPRFLETIMPIALGSLLTSKQIQIEWLNSLLQAMQ